LLNKELNVPSARPAERHSDGPLDKKSQIVAMNLIHKNNNCKILMNY